MLTLWESPDSIKAFAGDDINVAKYYDFDVGILFDLASHADHFEIYDE